MRVAGIGCRKGVAMAEVIAAVEAAFAALGASPLRGDEVHTENVVPKTPSPTRFAGHLSPASRGEEGRAGIAASDSSPPLRGRGAERMRGGEGVTRRENIHRQWACHGRETVRGSRISLERTDVHGVHALATSEAKALEPALIEAAKALGLPLIPVSQDELQSASSRCLTRSEASLAATGIASLSEAAALAAVGEKGRLLGPRIAEGNVTCAIAQNRDET